MYGMNNYTKILPRISICAIVWGEPRWKNLSKIPNDEWKHQIVHHFEDDTEC